MSYDKYGQQFLTEAEILKLLHLNTELDLSKIVMDNPKQFNKSVAMLFTGDPIIKQYKIPTGTLEEFDRENQQKWHMPDQYLTFDIITWLTEQCQTSTELLRVAEELELYSDRNLITLLKFLKYLVDTFRKNNIVWGVGRGSSVSSYVLYLIGIHKINSLEHKLSVEEFLR